MFSIPSCLKRASVTPGMRYALPARCPCRNVRNRSHYGADAEAPPLGEWEPTIALATYEACKEYYANHPLKSDEVAQKRVTALMTPPLFVAAPSDAIDALEDAFRVRGGIPVLNRKKEVVGIISRKDVKGMPPDTLVADTMTAPVVMTGPEKKVYQVAALMLEHRIRHVPVVGAHNQFLGEISAHDIFVALNP